MSWNNCKTCVFAQPPVFTSTLLKVLLTLKLLHGARAGCKGSTLEDISMYMLKHFGLDGDLKSQVLASLKYGVKQNFIRKNKDKFLLILPAAAVHLAPLNCKIEEMDRIFKVFPAEWTSKLRPEDPSICGKRNRDDDLCCGRPCQISSRSTDECDVCPAAKKPRFTGKPCPRPRPPICAHRKKKKCLDPYEDLCAVCPEAADILCDDNRQCYEAPPKPRRSKCRYKHDEDMDEDDSCQSAKRCQFKKEPRLGVCVRKRRRRTGKKVIKSSCSVCPSPCDDDAEENEYFQPPKNCSCCP